MQVLKKYFDKKTGKFKENRHWMKLCQKGTPDRFALIDSRIVFIEAKKRGEKPTVEQLAKHQELARHGAIIIVADSIENFITQFNALFPDRAQKVYLRG